MFMSHASQQVISKYASLKALHNPLNKDKEMSETYEDRAPSLGNVSCMLPVSVATDPRLKADHYRVLLALSSFGHGSSSTVSCTRDQIAERSGLFATDVSIATSDLAELGLIKKTVNHSGGSFAHYTCTYELLF